VPEDGGGADAPGFGMSAISEPDSMGRTAGRAAALLETQMFPEIKKRWVPHESGVASTPADVTSQDEIALSIAVRKGSLLLGRWELVDFFRSYSPGCPRR